VSARRASTNAKPRAKANAPARATRGASLLALVAVTVAIIVGWAPARAAAGTCSVASVSPVAFGGYDVFDAAPVDSTGSITLECTDVTQDDAVRVSLEPGGGGTFAGRRLIAGAFALAYQLYLDAARHTVWGDGTGGTTAYGPLPASEGTTTLTIFGRVPAGQDVGAGVYGDTITVTVEL
jgi:spore coat protein U-like protein